MFAPLSPVLKTSRLLPLALLSLLSVTLNGCGGHDQDKSAPPAPQVEHTTTGQVVSVQTRDIPVEALFPGSVITSDQVSVSSRVMGYVHSVDVHEGQTVKAGQTLLTIDSADVTGAIGQAKAGVDKALAGLHNAKANYERYRALYQENAVPKQVFEQMQTAYKVAQSNYTAAQSALAQAKAQLTYVKITAPFAGTITSRKVDPGQMAYPSAPLMVLQGGGRKQVEVQLNNQAFATIKMGEPLDVRYTDFKGQQHQFPGPVERMVEATDPVSHTHTVKLGIPEAIDVRSGNYVEVAVRVAHEPGLTVPVAAIHNRGGLEGVFVVDKNHQAWFRMVRLGQQTEGRQVILAGLTDGEQVVVQSDKRLQNGIVIQNTGTSVEEKSHHE